MAVIFSLEVATVRGTFWKYLFLDLWTTIKDWRISFLVKLQVLIHPAIAHAYLNRHLKLISGVLLWLTLNKTTVHLVFMLKILNLNSCWWEEATLSFLWHFSKTLSKQVARRMDYFVLKLITKYDQTGDSRSLWYKLLFYVKEYPEDCLIKWNQLLICISLKWIES